MKDDGNFQLRDQNFVVLWESYNHFTDTLVPGQALNLNNSLHSRQGEFNFSRGRFELCLQESGDVVLNRVSFPSNTNINAQFEAYYDSRTVDPYNKSANVGQKLIFDKYELYISKKNSSKFSIIGNRNETFLNDDFYYKATINYDGVFTLSYFPKYLKNVTSWLVAKTIPENMCSNDNFNNGKGVCGINSICNLRYDQRTMCTCLKGYSLIDSNNRYGGCKQNVQIICPSRHNVSHKDAYLMMRLSNIYWPKSEYKTCNSCTLEDCKDYCLQDCLCVLAFFNGSSCWKNNLPLLHGRKELTVRGTYFIKIDKTETPSSFSSEMDDQDNGKTKMKKVHETLIIVISIIFVISTLVGAIVFWKKHKKTESGVSIKSIVDKNLRIFTFKEITEITNNFREELGRGSCSIVYKGTIEADVCVAVKKLDKLFQDSDKEFQTEMNVIIETHHRNLVRLHGYCSEEQHRILVYELMSNGTLASFIFTPLKPSWNQRVWIIIGIARGLVYLHEECCTQIIHCDIKPQNILLDDDYNAKISDFGFAKLLLINQSHTKTGIRGTKGYVAPDWFRSAPITAKVDAYSFGVLLLEIICCRKNVEDDNVSEEKRILIDWAYDCYKAGRMDILLENDYEVVNDISKLEKFVIISIWCTQEDPSLRPPMKNVLLMLEGIVNVEIPPSPYLYSSSS
ncbi:G-type lectin S-receptor-like serine/threonine-protein kinase LECRK3 [Vicia villosa]|uniref:G-type lectin S-receptor-like serine/threonine-protein kinase LECRK3 n=1 Tax=Vicia villosa TaxID=3911 RepID=UPI00273B661F|nr:G-type lectin S-receptor-like serine/threonine-protein kinase LECRK3 [Vicia villosa]